MAEAKTPHGASAAAGHELSDLSPRNISFFGIGLAALIIFALLVIYGLMVWLRESAGRRAEPPSQLSVTREPRSEERRVGKEVRTGWLTGSGALAKVIIYVEW